MYCVKCGVRLQDGVPSCPLCQTPVWNPDADKAEPENRYSSRLPKRLPNERIPAAIFLTIVLGAVCSACFFFCMEQLGKVAWSGHVMLVSAVVYVCAVLPMWFRRPNPVIFVPVSFASIGGMLLYICVDTGGKWFLSFAFPVLSIITVLTTAAVVLLRYVGRWKLFIIGGLLIAIGGSSMLIEMFQHITFETRMFVWSPYAVSAFCGAGLFLLLAGIIKPLRQWLIRRAFL